MTPEGTTILEHLRSVALERHQRRGDATLERRVRAVKAYQHLRFAKTYADLLAQPRYAKAARFFLDDLYGPHDFNERDDQFARIVPALVRLFPHEIVQTVRALAELHAISELLDTCLAQELATDDVDAAAYVGGWQRVGRPADRERQIVLMSEIGQALDRYTRNPVLRHTLRLMRAPARAAGLGALQTFLERGFETFRDMRGADDFLDTIATRERALAATLFAVTAVAAETPALGQLP
jgi:hypothetical protein